MGLDHLPGFARPFGDAFRHRLALDRDDPVHLFEPTGDDFAQRGRVAGDPVRQDIAAGDGVLKGGKAVAEDIIHGLGTALRRLGEGGACLRQGVGDARTLARNGQDDVAAGAGKARMRLVRVVGDQLRHAAAMRAEGGFDIGDPRRELGPEALGCARENAARLVGPLGELLL
ncbi:hypothetical protein AEGHOMDF_4459 [Methylobacterium soli]|nr:hypothetical protein AEGHOMDF_4459 [Methylobacterium soli]